MTATLFNLALYFSVWLAIVSFITGEIGKPRAHHVPSSTGWPLMVSTTGAALLGIHILLALHVLHGWSHSSVVRAVADQARTIYGADWAGAVWMNYAFLGLWLAEILWWRVAPRSYFTRQWYLTAVFRGFFVLILVNAAIVFAAPSRRLLGGALMAVLLWVWRDTFDVSGPKNRGRVPARTGA